MAVAYFHVLTHYFTGGIGKSCNTLGVTFNAYGEPISISTIQACVNWTVTAITCEKNKVVTVIKQHVTPWGHEDV